jgi:hypothetical protein
MKDVVIWVGLACFLVGGPLVFIGRFAQITQRLANFFREDELHWKLGERLFWWGAALVALGLALMLVVYPKL